MDKEQYKAIRDSDTSLGAFLRLQEAWLALSVTMSDAVWSRTSRYGSNR